MSSLCRNGPGCSYLARGRCSYAHPRGSYGHHSRKEMVESPYVFVFVDSLFNVMEKGSEKESELAREEILGRIDARKVKECLNVLQETNLRQTRRWTELEEKSLGVMTKSYGYFKETIWEDFAINDLNFEAFKKLCSAAKRSIYGWDQSLYGDVTDSDSYSADEDGPHILDFSSMKEDFKGILRWVQREDIEDKRKTLVLAVFKNDQRKGKESVISWMEERIAKWERKEMEEDEENWETEEEYEDDADYMKSVIPGAYGERLDQRFKALVDLTEEGLSKEEFNKKLKSLLKQQEEEDKDGLYEKHLEEQFERECKLVSIVQQLSEQRGQKGPVDYLVGLLNNDEETN